MSSSAAANICRWKKEGDAVAEKRRGGFVAGKQGRFCSRKKVGAVLLQEKTVVFVAGKRNKVC